MLSALPKLAFTLSKHLKRESATVHTTDWMDIWIWSCFWDVCVEKLFSATTPFYTIKCVQIPSMYSKTLAIVSNYSLFLFFSTLHMFYVCIIRQKYKHLNIWVNYDHQYYTIALLGDHSLHGSRTPTTTIIIFLMVKSLLRSLLCISYYCCRFHSFTLLRFLVSVCSGYC